MGYQRKTGERKRPRVISRSLVLVCNTIGLTGATGHTLSSPNSRWADREQHRPKRPFFALPIHFLSLSSQPCLSSHERHKNTNLSIHHPLCTRLAALQSAAANDTLHHTAAASATVSTLSPTSDSPIDDTHHCHAPLGPVPVPNKPVPRPTAAAKTAPIAGQSDETPCHNYAGISPPVSCHSGLLPDRSRLRLAHYWPWETAPGHRRISPTTKGPTTPLLPAMRQISGHRDVAEIACPAPASRPVCAAPAPIVVLPDRSSHPHKPPLSPGSASGYGRCIRAYCLGIARRG